MEEIKGMVEDIVVFQEKCSKALAKIYEMASHEKEHYFQSCNKCVEKGKTFVSQDSKVCMVCDKVDDYIDKIVKELSLPHLVVEIYDQLKAKLKDGWIK